MPKIHWLVYVIIGLFVSLTSYRLDYEKLIFFFYAGLVFVLIGVIKLIIGRIKNKTNKKIVPANKVQTMQHQASHRQTPQHVKFCYNCGAALVLHHRFCTRCGARV